MIRIDPRSSTDRNVRDLIYAGRDARNTWHLARKLREDVLWGASPMIYQIEQAMVVPALTCGMRGLRRDDDKVRALYAEELAAAEPLREEAEAFVRERLAGWSEFNVRSGSQLAAALYGPRKAAPCPACDWTGIEITEYAQSRFEWGKPTKQYPNGRPIKRREIAQKQRACPRDHVYQGFGVKPYHTDSGRWSTDREDLGSLIVRERAARGNLDAARLAEIALAYGEHNKVPQELASPVRASDLRLPFNLSVGMTDTFRLSSGSNPFREGRNVQNLDHRTRRAGIYVADTGFRIGTFDQARAESHWLAALAQDPAYLEAHEGEVDTHAFVANMIWPELDWPGDRRAWKDFAQSTKFSAVVGLPYAIPRDSLRDASKVCQHAVPRGQGVNGIAKHLHCSRTVAERVERGFEDNFAVTMAWVRAVKQRIADREIVHLGRRASDDSVRLPADLEGPAVVMHLGDGMYLWRAFHTDPRAGGTQRDAIAFALQAPVALTTHIGFLRVWNELDHHSLDTTAGPYTLLLHAHDAVVCQLGPNADPDAVRYRMLVEYDVWGRPLCVPIDGKVKKTL